MKPKHLRPTPTSRRVVRFATVPLVLLATLAAGAPAMAAKAPAGSGTSSLAVVVETGPDQVPNFGETITFDVQSTVDRKWVDLFCYQNGSFVYSQTAGFYPDYPWAPDYTLSSAYWSGGGASCDARLYTTNARGKQTTLATLSFDVLA